MGGGFGHFYAYAPFKIEYAIAERPAVQRGRMVNRVFGEPSSQLWERHDAGDFETKTADKLQAS